jgi:hypothetical protein
VGAEVFCVVFCLVKDMFEVWFLVAGSRFELLISGSLSVCL